MEYKNHITFFEKDHVKLTNYLKATDIKYDCNDTFCSFDILESNKHWKAISKILKRYKRWYLTETIFTKEELNAAEWLSVRSIFRFDYPQPEDEYQEITYNGQKCDECNGGLIQIDSFRFKKAPKLKNRHFFTTNWKDEVLFLSEDAKSKIENMNIPGISYKEVKNKTGTKIFPDIYQLVVDNILPEGLIQDLSSVDEKTICKKCGRTRYSPAKRGQLVYFKETFDNAPDIVQTYEIFGNGGYNQRKILLGKKVYQLIIDNKMDRALKFEPIKLISKNDFSKKTDNSKKGKILTYLKNIFKN